MAETEGLTIAKNLTDAIELATNYSISVDQDEIVLIGGYRIFDEGMKHVNKLVISWVDAPNIKGDVYFLALIFQNGIKTNQSILQNLM